ncbi:MAG: metallopeptidase family protein [Candidatus Eisenbacteria bacterium]
MFTLSEDEFRAVAAEAIESLPEEFRTKLDNVDVVVEDYPPAEVLRKFPRGRLILGLYQGVPNKFRSSNYKLVMPDKISLYKRNIEAVCSTRVQVYRRIRKTLLHEIGHHFSLSDRDLRNMGW